MSNYSEKPTLDEDVPGGRQATPPEVRSRVPSQFPVARTIKPQPSAEPHVKAISGILSRPQVHELPTATLATPPALASSGTASHQSQEPSEPNQKPLATSNNQARELPAAMAVASSSMSPVQARNSVQPSSNTSTVVPSSSEKSTDSLGGQPQEHNQEEVEVPESVDVEKAAFAPIKSGATEKAARRSLETTDGHHQIKEDDIFRTLSRRKQPYSPISRQQTQEQDEEQQEIERLLSRMFGRTRQAASEEEKSRHLGVVWKNITVKGMGLGAALQPSTGDVFMTLPRFLKGLFTQGSKAVGSKPAVRTLLDNFSGCIKPGEMILVLGRPGSGCSTFLKILGNQRFGYESIEGEVTYGGTDSKTMMKKYRGEVLYNPEDDLHYATLKVKDTLRFALKTRAPGKESRKEGESRADYINEFLRVISKLFWIEHTMNTKVGNAFIRGVSGGEKKRVSIAEAMITRASTQCWDNSTRGLDASTALEYVSSIRSLTNMTHISTAVALYQAGESLYNLFDKVILIEGGKCCYFGNADKAADYFKNLGFVKPDRWTTADFLTSVTDEHERHVKDGWEDRIPRSAAQFAEAFAKSDISKNNAREIEEFEEDTKRLVEERHAQQTKEMKTKNYAVPFHKQVMACTNRQFLVLIGDRQSLIGKWGGILFQAVIAGSLFYNLPQTAPGAYTRGGILFFMLLFNALLALAELTAAFESKPILLKHKTFSFYRPAAYAIAQTVVDIPLVFIQVAIFNFVVYFMANLQRTASQFLISLLIIFSVTMTMYAFFRSIGALMGSLDAATQVTGVAIQALIVYTGYLIPPSKMHPWFSWLRWINPVQYAFEALMANEFYNLKIQCVPPFLVPLGPGATPENQGCTLQGSQPGSTFVNGADYIQVAFTYSRSHLWRNFGLIWAFFALFSFLTALGMEMQRPNKGGGAVTIYKRGQAPRSVENSIAAGEKVKDEESGKHDPDTGGNNYSHGENNDKPAKGVARNDAVFTWQNLNYTIPYEGGERKLLQNVQGFVKPGRLTALMGASGAGKTTLLSALSQRIRFGVVSGDFLMDGRPLPRSFQRSSGFAEQQDIHEPTATVREALRFSAKLRQPKEVPLQEKYEYCERIIDLLEMHHIAGAAIGEIGNGLNQEQRKRLTIGVELASKPELLMFLDEPTSGLDSAAAFNIIRFLRKLADAGQAILCTVHQPSSVLFENFDTLLLLKSGGRTAYFGELGKDSRTLINYLEANGAKKCPPNANPAEYMLEAIGAGNPDYKGQDWGDVWEKSDENLRISEEIQKMSSERRNASSGMKTMDSREYAMPLTTQLYAVIYRSFTAIWRSPDYLVGMFMLHIVTGLFNTFTFWHIGNSQIDMQSRVFSIFMTITISPPLIQQLQPRFMHARNIFSSREANSKIYSWPAFVAGAIISEIPYRILAGTIYWCCWYWATAFPRDTYTAASMWLMVMAFELYYLGFGMAIASFAPNELLASLLVPVFFTFAVSFCGVVVPYAALPYFWRQWMYWLTPFRYIFESMLGLVTHNVPVECADHEFAKFSPPLGQSCDSYAGPFAANSGGYVKSLEDGLCGFCQYANGDQFSASFNVFNKFVWRDFGITWGYIMFDFAVVFLCTWLYLDGGRRIKNALSPAGRKARKLRAKESKRGDEKA